MRRNLESQIQATSKICKFAKLQRLALQPCLPREPLGGDWLLWVRDSRRVLPYAASGVFARAPRAAKAHLRPTTTSNTASSHLQFEDYQKI